RGAPEMKKPAMAGFLITHYPSALDQMHDPLRNGDTHPCRGQLLLGLLGEGKGHRPEITGRNPHTQGQVNRAVAKPGDKHYRLRLTQHARVLGYLQQKLPRQLDIAAVVDTDVDVRTAARLAGKVGDMPVGKRSVRHHPSLVI